LTHNTLNHFSTALLFKRINEQRQAKHQPLLENALLASKLGILIAVKTDKYINFRAETVTLNGRQLVALAAILEEYFNVNMQQDMRELVSLYSHEEQKEPDISAVVDKTAKPAKQVVTESGLLHRFKRFFAKKRT